MRKPFDDIRVRQALNYAVDKQAFAKVVCNGYAVPLNSCLPANLSGYVSQGAPWPYDPAKAKALLAEAGYPNGFSSTVWGNNASLTQKAMQFLQQQFAQVGVKVEVEPLEAGVAAAKIWNVTTREDATTLMDYVGLVVLDRRRRLGPAPAARRRRRLPAEAVQHRLLRQPHRSTRTSRPGWKPPTPAKRAAAYKDAQAVIWKDAPWVFLDSDYNVSAKSKKLSGIYVMPDGQMLTEDADAEQLISC